MILLIISGIGMSPYVLMCFVLLSESAGDKCRLINNECKLFVLIAIRIYFQNVFCFNNF
jgi:hypothetical protein